MEAEILKAINGLYDAVAAPEFWAPALHRFARATNSVGCVFYPQDQAASLPHLPVSPDLKEFIGEFVTEGWHLTDLHAMRGWPIVGSGKPVITDEDIYLPGERDRDPNYQDFHRKWSLTEWAAIGFPVDGDLWCLPLLRTGLQGPADRDLIRHLAAAGSHLSRIITLASTLGAKQAQTYIRLLEGIGRPAALVDRSGRLVAFTAQAEALLDRDLKVAHGRLFARDKQSDDKLQALVASAVAGGGASLATGRMSVAVRREDRRPIIVQAIGLAGLLLETFNPAKALLLFSDLDERRAPAGEILRSAFGLSPAETRLAIELAQGASLDEAAARLEIGRETARTQLKAIFAKAGARGQADLAAVLARMTVDRLDKGS